MDDLKELKTNLPFRHSSGIAIIPECMWRMTRKHDRSKTPEAFSPGNPGTKKKGGAGRLP